MSALAEDLLKTRSISELRSLIQQMHKEAEDKKADLRSMVGSQYQEFIQSADKISEMRHQSKALVQVLEDFWSKNQAFASHVQNFVSQDVKSKKPAQILRTQQFNIQGMR